MPLRKLAFTMPSMVPPNARPRLAFYLANALSSSKLSPRRTAALFAWAVEHADAIGLSLPPDFRSVWQEDEQSTPNKRAWREMERALNAASPKSPASRPFAKLAALLGLDETEQAILTLVADYAGMPAVEGLWDELSGDMGMALSMTINPALFAMLLGATNTAIAKRLNPEAPLRASGLLSVETHRQLVILERLVPFVVEAKPPKNPTAALIGRATTAELPVDAFSHLGQTLGHVRALVRGALAERAKGIHVLLYGPPGTGKTALAASLAADAGVPLHEVGMSAAGGEEPVRDQRLAELRLAQRLLGSSEPALLLVDEAEDLFDGGCILGLHRHAGSRAFMHRLLENAAVPTIWTANDIKGFSPAVLRRMACAIEVKIPPPPTRQRLWQEAAEAEAVPLPPADAARLAHLLPAAPAQARSAMRAARLAGGDVATVRWALSGVARAMAGGRLPTAAPEEQPFEPRLTNADMDLVALAERLAQPSATRSVSLLLCGPPGTGKSAYARHLAQRMGLPVLHKRASDLLAPFVGETEQKIAAAFEEARDQEAFLIFDEADSLLTDRRSARQGWEVSQVNEMLTWMEAHPLPFCCTTNLVERLDEASKRRFLVKAKLDFLTSAQLQLAWARFFEPPAPAALTQLHRLTPADFALVARLAALQGSAAETGWLLAALEREQRAKPGTASPLGFALAPPH